MRELDRVEEAVHAAQPARIGRTRLRQAFGRVGALLEKAALQEEQELFRLFTGRIDVAQDGLALHVARESQSSGPAEGNRAREQGTDGGGSWHKFEPALASVVEVFSAVPLPLHLIHAAKLIA